MEPNNMQIIAKKFWHMLRVAIFMLKKGILKSRLLSDLNIMMKRGKIAGKAIHNLMFHHGHQWATTSAAASTTTRRYIHEYEFSCSNTPMHPFNLSKRKNAHYHYNQIRPQNVRIDPDYYDMFSAAQSPMVVEDEIMTPKAVMKALELMHSEAVSPAMPGFERSPMVRQLRITDSPFPLNYCGEEDNHVDEAAENFIKKFYKDLRNQNVVAAY
ncbi:hypothetical protein Leryth_010228 [Lithospermum erythrorhizon]|nr:hypothetical protein Leryth_010228 [Lithospermum erythrorhizon]